MLVYCYQLRDELFRGLVLFEVGFDAFHQFVVEFQGRHDGVICDTARDKSPPPFVWISLVSGQTPSNMPALPVAWDLIDRRDRFKTGATAADPSGGLRFDERHLRRLTGDDADTVLLVEMTLDRP